MPELSRFFGIIIRMYDANTGWLRHGLNCISQSWERIGNDFNRVKPPYVLTRSNKRSSKWSIQSIGSSHSK